MDNSSLLNNILNFLKFNDKRNFSKPLKELPKDETNPFESEIDEQELKTEISKHLDLLPTDVFEIDFENVKLSKQGFSALLESIFETHKKSLNSLEEGQEDEFHMDNVFEKRHVKTYYTIKKQLVICASINMLLGIFEIPEEHWEVDYNDEIRWH